MISQKEAEAELRRRQADQARRNEQGLKRMEDPAKLEDDETGAGLLFQLGYRSALGNDKMRDLIALQRKELG
jgi:hypothetical protein